ncbi:glycosyl transferase family 1 [Agrobacterium sp. rho-8.1]|nr:glycosyl transferase family 1 [Agrobacterium sp. rho-8.1]
MTHILYLAHDLADPAIRRRVMTLQAGGAKVSLAGFTRGENRLATVDGVTPIILGETADGQFVQRILSVVKSSFSLKHLLKNVTRPDVIIARNLEMLALSRRVSSIYGRDVPVVYECLDIHRLLLNEGPAGTLVNAAQRYFAKDAKLLITSSPAFVSQYFAPRSGLALPVLLQENKVLVLDANQAQIAPQPRAPKAGEPWRIGWFGALRCRKSLEILGNFAKRMDGKVEIVLRGRPAYSEFDDFDGYVANAPHVTFRGPYKNPEDLASIYDDVHFTWAIDFFEEGQNSSWLLPNRLYEGCLYGTLPIAVAGTETARFLETRNIGHVLPIANTETLEALFQQMDEPTYLESFKNLASIDRDHWVTDNQDCIQLVHKLASLAAPHNGRSVAAKLSTA